MRQNDAKNLMLYYKHIPGMIKVFRKQKEELLYNYDSGKAIAYSDMPHGSESVDTTEFYGMAAAEKNVSGRIREIEKRISELKHDREIINSVLDSLNGEYKTILIYKLVYDYSWTKVSIRLRVPDSTIRYRFGLALERLSECASELKECRDLIKKASRAR